MYGNNPGFVPQPDEFTNISYHDVLLIDWQFNKTAWVLASQVRGSQRGHFQDP
jgi:hypothetical protein